MKIQKLFLTFAAVLHGLTTRKVTVEDLDHAIFCTSEREINDANHIDDPLHDQALVALAKAKTENRLIFQTGTEYNNTTTFVEINQRLAAFKLAPLTGLDDGNLAQIPMFCCVPSSSDGSYEVLWAACPTPEKKWRRSWGALPATA